VRQSWALLGDKQVWWPENPASVGLSGVGLEPRKATGKSVTFPTVRCSLFDLVLCSVPVALLRGGTGGVGHSFGSPLVFAVLLDRTVPAQGWVMTKRLREFWWNLFVIVTITWLVWIEILIQIKFAKGRAILRDIQEIQERIEVRHYE